MRAIVKWVIVAFCLISMLVALGHYFMLFGLRNVRVYSTFGGTVWILNEKNTWQMIPVFISFILVAILLFIVALKDFIGKKDHYNLINFFMILATMVLLAVAIIFTIIFLKSMWTNGYDSHIEIPTSYFTAYMEIFSTSVSFVIPAYVVTAILFVKIIKNFIEKSKQQNNNQQIENTSQLVADNNNNQ